MIIRVFYKDPQPEYFFETFDWEIKPDHLVTFSSRKHNVNRLRTYIPRWRLFKALFTGKLSLN